MLESMIVFPRFDGKCSVLTKGVFAEVQFSLRKMQVGGVSSTTSTIPLETFASNKDMGRVLVRRGGETIAAGMLKPFECIRQLAQHASRCYYRDQ
jgi:hypothetical protein